MYFYVCVYVYGCVCVRVRGRVGAWVNLQVEYHAVIAAFEVLLGRMEAQPIRRAKRMKEVLQSLAAQFRLIVQNCDIGDDGDDDDADERGGGGGGSGGTAAREPKVAAYALAFVGLMHRLHAKYGVEVEGSILEEEDAEAMAIINRTIRAEALACLGQPFASLMPVAVAEREEEGGTAENENVNGKGKGEGKGKEKGGGLKEAPEAEGGPAGGSAPPPQYNVDYSPTKTGYGPAARATAAAAAAATAAAAALPQPPPVPAPVPVPFLKQVVELVLDTQVQLLAVLEVGVVKAARDAYRTAHGLDGESSDDDDGDDDDDDDSDGSSGAAAASSDGCEATLADCSLAGVAQLAYLVLAEGFSPARVPAVLRPGYLVQVCDPLLRNLLATDNSNASVVRGAKLIIALAERAGDYRHRLAYTKAALLEPKETPPTQLLIQHMVSCPDAAIRALLAEALRCLVHLNTAEGKHAIYIQLLQSCPFANAIYLLILWIKLVEILGVLMQVPESFATSPEIIVTEYDKIAAVCNLFLFVLLRGPSGEVPKRVREDVLGIWNVQLLDEAKTQYIAPLQRGCAALLSKCKSELEKADAAAAAPVEGVGTEAAEGDASSSSSSSSDGAAAATVNGNTLQVELDPDAMDAKMPTRTRMELMQTMMRVEILQGSVERIASIMAEGADVLG